MRNRRVNSPQTQFSAPAVSCVLLVSTQREEHVVCVHEHDGAGARSLCPSRPAWYQRTGNQGSAALRLLVNKNVRDFVESDKKKSHADRVGIIIVERLNERNGGAVLFSKRTRTPLDKRDVAANAVRVREGLVGQTWMGKHGLER